MLFRSGNEARGPSLVLIEAPMGEGKTEAAWYLADCWNRRGGAGAYVALPTMATSNQMFERVTQFLGRSEAAGLMLLHGKSSLNENFAKSGATQGEIYDDDGKPAGVIAESWFAANKKHGLLAPHGVGTIDQALLAVLQDRKSVV